MIQLITQLNYTISEILMHFIPHLNKSFKKKKHFANYYVDVRNENVGGSDWLALWPMGDVTVIWKV